VVSVSLSNSNHGNWTLKSELPGAMARRNANGASTLKIPSPPLEIDPDFSLEPAVRRDKLLDFIPVARPGDRTHGFRVVSEQRTEHKVVLEIEGPGGTVGGFSLVRNGKLVPKANGASLSMSDAAASDASVPILLSFKFPAGEGWKTITVTLTW